MRVSSAGRPVEKSKDLAGSNVEFGKRLIFETTSADATLGAVAGTEKREAKIEEFAEIMGHVAVGDPTAQHVPRGDMPLFTRIVPMLCSLPRPARVWIERNIARSEDIGDICLQKLVNNHTLFNINARSLEKCRLRFYAYGEDDDIAGDNLTGQRFDRCHLLRSVKGLNLFFELHVNLVALAAIEKIVGEPW